MSLKPHPLSQRAILPGAWGLPAGLAVPFLLLSVLEGSPAEDSPRLAGLFPESGQVPGWERSEGPSFFVGEEIFQYMDGAGEIPRSYGFRQLGTAQYLQGEATLEVVLFEMEDPAAAFGYFSVRDRDLQERFLPLLPPARVVPGFVLVAWKGPYTVVVRVAQGSVPDEVLAQWGRSVLRNLSGKAPPPDLLRYLPRKERVPHSEKYVRGKAAFDAEVLFLPEDVFGLRNSRVEIVSAEYQPGERTPRRSPYQLVLFRYPNRRAAAPAVRKFALSRSGAEGKRPPERAPWIAPDSSGRFEGAFQEGPFVGVVLGAPNQEQALRVLRGFQRFVVRFASGGNSVGTADKPR